MWLLSTSPEAPVGVCLAVTPRCVLVLYFHLKLFPLARYVGIKTCSSSRGSCQRNSVRLAGWQPRGASARQRPRCSELPALPHEHQHGGVRHHRSLLKHPVNYRHMLCKRHGRHVMLQTDTSETNSRLSRSILFSSRVFSCITLHGLSLEEGQNFHFMQSKELHLY